MSSEINKVVMRPSDQLSTYRRDIKRPSAVLLTALVFLVAITGTAKADYLSDIQTSDIDQRLYEVCPDGECLGTATLGDYLPGDRDTDGLAGFETLEEILFDWNRAALTTLLGDSAGIGNGTFIDPGTWASVAAGWDSQSADGYAEAAHIPSPAAGWLMGIGGTMLVNRKPSRRVFR